MIFVRTLTQESNTWEWNVLFHVRVIGLFLRISYKRFKVKKTVFQVYLKLIMEQWTKATFFHSIHAVIVLFKAMLWKHSSNCLV